MNRCKSCKWWNGEEANVLRAPKGWRQCTHRLIASEENCGAIERVAVHEWAGVKYENYDDIPLEGRQSGKIEYLGTEIRCKHDDALWGSAEDYYNATVFVGPEFGCIHHEEKT